MRRSFNVRPSARLLLAPAALALALGAGLPSTAGADVIVSWNNQQATPPAATALYVSGSVAEDDIRLSWNDRGTAVRLDDEVTITDATQAVVIDYHGPYWTPGNMQCRQTDVHAVTCQADDLQRITAWLWEGDNIFSAAPPYPSTAELPLSLKVHGDSGKDKIYGGAGPDRLFGGPGRDRLSGRGGDDEVRGDAGDDRVNGNGGSDELFGEEGSDLLGLDDADGDLISGGTGTDTVDYHLRTAPVTVTIGTTAGDDGAAGEGDTITGSVEHVLGGTSDDWLVGDSDSNTLDGGAGADRLLGLEGDDELRGGDGQDRLYGMDGDDLLRSDDGLADQVSCGVGHDIAEADHPDVLLDGCEQLAGSAAPILVAAPPSGQGPPQPDPGPQPDPTPQPDPEPQPDQTEPEPATSSQGAGQDEAPQSAPGATDRPAIARRAALRSGKAVVALRCPRSATRRCAGLLVLLHRQKVVGSARYSLRAGRSASVQVRVTPAARRAVARRGALRIQARAVPRRGDARARRAVVLR